MTDLIVRGGSIVTPTGVLEADISVEGGKITAITPEPGGSAKEEVDASGLHVFPGAVDAHVHFNEPGRTDWEGFASGARALAAGGLTSYIEMPLNAYPPTTDAESLEQKVSIAEKTSLVDFAFFGGLVPGNLSGMEGLAAGGVAGFKAFMSATGTEDFAPADDLTLYEGMCEAARLGLPVLVHAENRTLTDSLARRAVATLRTSAQDYLESRPAVAELEAINRAILLAREAGCSLHIVHVSTGRGVALVAEARARGVDVTCETCPHYLTFTAEDLERLGAVAKCAPPLRSPEDRGDLRRMVAVGEVDFIASDHSPCPPHMKSGDDFFRAWGGISGCQSLLNATLDFGLSSGLNLQSIAALVSGNVAKRFGLAGKGRIEVGSDADFAFVELDSEFTLNEEDLFYRHPTSPYVGRTFRGKSVRTMLRGRTVFLNGEITSEPVGRFLRPGNTPDPSKGKA